MTKPVRLFWIGGTLLLLLPPLVRSVSSPASLTGVRTPIDRVNPLYARQWRLLEQAAGVIPPGDSYTVTARDLDHEMLLFMLSKAALPDRLAHPTSYWRITQQAQGARARYVVAYECARAADEERVVHRFEEGCVLVRPGRAP